jgi:hypothetical protein
VESEPRLPLAPSKVNRGEREWLLKSHCDSWSLETICRRSRMWMKKSNPGITRYLLRLPRSKLRILVGIITGQALEKHLHNMGLIDEPICIACYIFYICTCPSLIALRVHTFLKPILKNMRGRLHCCNSRWHISYEHFFFLYCLILSVCLFVSF